MGNTSNSTRAAAVDLASALDNLWQNPSLLLPQLEDMLGQLSEFKDELVETFLDADGAGKVVDVIKPSQTSSVLWRCGWRILYRVMMYIYIKRRQSVSMLVTTGQLKSSILGVLWELSRGYPENVAEFNAFGYNGMMDLFLQTIRPETDEEVARAQEARSASLELITREVEDLRYEVSIVSSAMLQPLTDAAERRHGPITATYLRRTLERFRAAVGQAATEAEEKLWAAVEYYASLLHAAFLASMLDAPSHVPIVREFALESLPTLFNNARKRETQQYLEKIFWYLDLPAQQGILREIIYGSDPRVREGRSSWPEEASRIDRILEACLVPRTLERNPTNYIVLLSQVAFYGIPALKKVVSSHAERNLVDRLSYATPETLEKFKYIFWYGLSAKAQRKVIRAAIRRVYQYHVDDMRAIPLAWAVIHVTSCLLDRYVGPRTPEVFLRSGAIHFVKYVAVHFFPYMGLGLACLSFLYFFSRKFPAVSQECLAFADTMSVLYSANLASLTGAEREEWLEIWPLFYDLAKPRELSAQAAGGRTRRRVR